MIRRLLARLSAALVADDPHPAPSQLDLLDRQARTTYWLGPDPDLLDRPERHTPAYIEYVADLMREQGESAGDPQWEVDRRVTRFLNYALASRAGAR